MNNNQLRLLGACLASLNMLIGCAVFVASEVLPPSLGTETSILQTGGLIVWLALGLGLFSLPFSMLGGYAMTWLLQKARWLQYQSSKVILSGAIIASTGLLGTFVMGAVAGLCFQGECSGNLSTDVQGIFHDAVLMKLLFIAVVCGGVTALQLSRSAQRETA
jgi:hypothetical protein